MRVHVGCHGPEYPQHSADTPVQLGDVPVLIEFHHGHPQDQKATIPGFGAFITNLR